MGERPSHPGRTPAQRKALDAIGCGDFSPRMSKRTGEALLAAGLIVPAGSKVIGQDRFGVIVVAKWAMPIPVHMQWCEAVGATDEEMAAFEAEMDAQSDPSPPREGRREP